MSSLEIGWWGEISQIAKFHEMGTTKLPKRSHLHKVYESEDFKNFSNSNYVKNAFSSSLDNGLKAIGELFINYYKSFVLAGNITPELKKCTVEQKTKRGSVAPETPLVDTGKMVNSISYKVGK